ncbi:MAG: 50S ribosomal protein L6 [Thermoanaerobaculales bacterium]|nr:50S ribosomal protein L6 [Thermoanaerobaculales bacterium]
MSRIGKTPIPIPKGVDIHVGNGVVQVKGPKGKLLVHLMPGIGAEAKDGNLELTRENEERQTRAFHGLNRALLANATAGVFEGWKKELDIIGIGYRAEKQGTAVIFSLGYSHPVNFPVPEDIEIEVDGKANRVTVTGIDRQRVGQVAAEIRALRPPEPYKGKGIRYTGEYVRIKAGKQGATV